MYRGVNYRYRKFLFFAIKLSIVVGCVYFIYQKLTQNQQISFSKFSDLLYNHIVSNPKIIAILLGFTAINWLLEILKWQNIVTAIQNISFFEATKQSLGSMTVGLFTPNRIGEYGAKALYFKKGKKKVVFLNFFSNLAQLTATLIFGATGFIYFVTQYNVEFSYVGLRRALYTLTVVVLFVLFGSANSRRTYGGMYLDKAKAFLQSFTSTMVFKTFLLAFLRFVVFSCQFYFLLTVFGYNLPFWSTFALISAMYLVASLVPSFSLFDWAVKGSVALWIFTFVSVAEIHIVTISLLMWLLNFALPSLIGSYFVLTYKKAVV